MADGYKLEIQLRDTTLLFDTEGARNAAATSIRNKLEAVDVPADNIILAKYNTVEEKVWKLVGTA